MFNGFSFGAGFELMRRVIAPAILVATPLMLWWWLGPEKPSCDSARQLAARSAIAQVAERIRTERGDIRRAAVLHIANDPSDYVTLSLRSRLAEGGLLDLDGTPPSEKIRNLLNLRNEGQFDVEKAIEYGKSHGLDAVLIGVLDEFETVKGKAVLKGQLKFVRISKGDVVDIPFSDDASGGGSAAEIAKACDGTVLVIEYNKTRRREIIDAQRQIAQSGCPVLGCIINKVTFDSLSAKKYYNKSYYSHYNNEYYKRDIRMALVRYYYDNDQITALDEFLLNISVLEKNGFTLVVSGIGEDWGYEEPTISDKWIR